ncbi:hypothetical protein JNK13_08445 [bacterium]|nr:hypothetical protein [bacterium]
MADSANTFWQRLLIAAYATGIVMIAYKELRQTGWDRQFISSLKSNSVTIKSDQRQAVDHELSNSDKQSLDHYFEQIPQADTKNDH